jgi:hypothetical protein
MRLPSSGQATAKILLFSNYSFKEDAQDFL